MANADCTVERVARVLAEAAAADDGATVWPHDRRLAMRILAALQPVERWYADYRREVEVAR